jgi:EpsI family protein
MLNVRLAVLAVTMTLCAWALDARVLSETPPPPPALASLPWEIAGWRGAAAPPLDAKSVAALGADQHLNRIYVGADGIPLWVFVGYYGSQRQGRAIHSPANCLPGAGWLPVSDGRLTLAFDDGPESINRYVVQKELDRQVVLYWYQSHGRVVASEYAAKWFLVQDAVRLNRTDGAIVRVSRPVVRASDAFDEAGAERAAAELARALYPLLRSRLPS